MASSGSYKKLVPKYIKFIVLEKISECKRSINCIVGEIQNATSHLEHLNGMIEMLEGMHFTLEIYDSVWCLREMVKSENKKLLDLKKHLVVAEEDIRGFVDRNMIDDMLVLDEVVFKIHKNRHFELDPLSILENKWALFYCLPNKSLEKGLKLIHTDNDVHSFFADVERRDDEPLGRKLLKTSRKGKEKMDEFPDLTPIKERKYCDDRVGRMSMQTFMNELGEFPDLTSTKEREVDDEAVVVTNYRRAIINGKAKMVEVADVQESNVKAETNELPENYFVFEVHYDGVFSEYPLRYEHGKTLTLKLSKSNKMLFSKMLDMLSYKLECQIWAIFVCSPRCSLGEGLTIVEDDGDMKKLYAIAKKYGLVNLYIAHIPENLAEYYFKILTLDASDEEVKSKVKSHEKRKLHASAMSPHELVEWAEQEAGSPYLRTPSIKSIRKDGPIDVGGPSTWCDLAHEYVVENGDSLPIMDKECFSNNVVLDDVVPVVYHQRLYWKRVACGANTRRLGGSPSLNVHVVDEVSHVTKQGSLSAGSTNTEDKDLGSMSAGSSNTDDKDLEKSN
ncbi:hypothetical protein Tco_0705442 [Tanacetum coccineum]|uniref:Uncharacterized protein n=1 Tax=Tanacetum coccineum TaxID=301880 RepID=A0ABQ4Y600_9ASTR